MWLMSSNGSHSGHYPGRAQIVASAASPPCTDRQGSSNRVAGLADTRATHLDLGCKCTVRRKDKREQLRPGHDSRSCIAPSGVRSRAKGSASGSGGMSSNKSRLSSNTQHESSESKSLKSLLLPKEDRTSEKDCKEEDMEDEEGGE
ncbi:hypothetical protein E2C01_039082 [Portunus trituberculatus]|uniref:Uncharacterized protein n=1 Tax=Portunus trituberculatus TaxID=210409 RepID=A0A5B7FLT2_PORTR|nr:hypothetical protein [Portunus trituberculatus]